MCGFHLRLQMQLLTKVLSFVEGGTHLAKRQQPRSTRKMLPLLSQLNHHQASGKPRLSFVWVEAWSLAHLENQN
jgi:hypothetical protein